MLYSFFVQQRFVFYEAQGEENKVYAKQNQADSNVLMRENTTEETNNLKEEFGKRIQDIEKESNEKQEPKSVDEMILEQPQLLRDVNFVQQNYDAVSKAVNAQPSLMQYIGSQNGLTPSAGVFYGPSGKETYYNLDISGFISIMRGMGNNDEYWVRMDGAKMLGDYIMVAADLNKHPRGSIVETSLGQGIVCDTGSFTYTSDTQLDIATNW